MGNLSGEEVRGLVGWLFLGFVFSPNGLDD
jgi:hypothetical protein